MSNERDDTILHQADVEAVIESVAAEVIEESVGLTGAAIADADETHALNATFDDTEVEGALNALAGTINEILAQLRVNGIIAEE